MKNDTKRSRLPLAAGLILFAAAALWALTRSFGCGADSIPGATNEQRIAYIESFGWDPGFTHTAVENVRIPVEFDDVYEEYNALQRKQGFDLRKYRAHTVKRYTYEITNHPSGEQGVTANLLVRRGKLIAADVSSPQADGFVHGLREHPSEPQDTP